MPYYFSFRVISQPHELGLIYCFLCWNPVAGCFEYLIWRQFLFGPKGAPRFFAHALATKRYRKWLYVIKRNVLRIDFYSHTIWTLNKYWKYFFRFYIFRKLVKTTTIHRLWNFFTLQAFNKHIHEPFKLANILC